MFMCQLRTIDTPVYAGLWRDWISGYLGLRLKLYALPGANVAGSIPAPAHPREARREEIKVIGDYMLNGCLCRLATARAYRR